MRSTAARLRTIWWNPENAPAATNATSAVDSTRWSPYDECVISIGTTTSDDSSIFSSSRCTPIPVTSLVVPAPANTALFWPEAIFELVQADHADRRQQRVVVSRVQQPRQDRAGILAHVAGLGVRRDVDDDRGQTQDVLEQLLDQERLAAAGGAGQQHVHLRQQRFAHGAVQIDPLDSPHEAIRQQRHRPARLDLAAVPLLFQLREDRLRRQHGQLAHELDEMLEP